MTRADIKSVLTGIGILLGVVLSIPVWLFLVCFEKAVAAAKKVRRDQEGSDRRG